MVLSILLSVAITCLVIVAGLMLGGLVRYERPLKVLLLISTAPAWLTIVAGLILGGAVRYHRPLKVMLLITIASWAIIVPKASEPG